ncbi:MAG: 3-deoxy-D-manno-octulosonic acid transferase [Pseudomonadota bacterium]
MAQPAATLPLRLYGALGRVLSGPALARTDKKLTAAGISDERLAERRGWATQARPHGSLIWVHAASVGESLSALPLISRFIEDHAVLVTSGTGTSARIMADRLPEGAIHQFAPIDTAPAVRAFFDHWRPDLGVFVESELWPRLILDAEARNIPLALVNARMSDRSLVSWSRVPATARRVLSAFRLIVTQNAETCDGLRPFVSGTTKLCTGTNLKTATPAPSANASALADWQGLLVDRPAWTASSTHPGEDGPILEAHQRLLQSVPNALCILIPRHPERGPGIAELAASHGLRAARRGAGHTLSSETQVYVADTIGETGLWYRAAPVVFLAGSFGDAGGHNPWEPIGCGAALLFGPKVPNAAADYAALTDLGAARQVDGAPSLATAVADLLRSPKALRDMRDAAEGATGEADKMADALSADLIDLIRHTNGG